MDILEMFSQQPIDFKCPNCSFILDIYLKEMWLEERIICRGCKYNIHLIDKDGSVQKAKRDINNSLRSLNKVLSKTITLKL